MFKNVEELRDLIKQGKTNEEIIKSQIEYLNSDNYCISKHKSVNYRFLILNVHYELKA